LKLHNRQDTGKNQEQISYPFPPNFPLKGWFMSVSVEFVRTFIRSRLWLILLFAGSNAWIGTASAVPPGPTSDSPVRTINGDWIVQGQQTIENEKLVINGQVRVLSNATLVLKNTVLEINFPSDSFDMWSRSGITSLYVEPGGAIEFTQSSVVTAQPRAMLLAETPQQIVIRNSTFRNIEIAIIHATQAVIDDNAFTLQPDHDLSDAISFWHSSLTHISGNSIIGEPGLNQNSGLATNGISLMFSDHNEVHGNTILNIKNGVSLHASSNNQISGNMVKGGKWWTGEGGIALQSWSNNNVIENNSLENSGSAILFILQSKNNKIAGNAIRDAGLGIVLRWTSGNIINGNTLDRILEDGIFAYRSYGNSIHNNQINHAGEGISLFTSWENQVGGNVMQVVDRGLYLFDARENQIRGNEIRNSVQSVLAVQSAGNVLSENNFLQSVLPAIEENASGAKNVWQGNYWENAPSSIVDSGSVANAFSILSVATPSFQPIDFGESHSEVTQISGEVVWEGQTKTITKGISIAPGGRLIIRNSILTFSPEGMQQRIWIHVPAGSALEIEGSEINGPEKDHFFMIRVYEGGEISMRNSKLRNAGSWVGDFGAAIGYEGRAALIDNNTFENVFCAFSSEPPAANIQFINNTITNTIKGVTIIGDAANSTIASNLIQQSAIWGIQIESHTPHIGSVVRDNRVENGWGMGIFDLNANSFTISPNNTFAGLKGLGLVSLESSFLTGRQFRPIYLSTANVLVGDKVAVKFDLMPYSFPPYDTQDKTFVPVLTVNGLQIARKEVTVKEGELVPVTLEGTATSAGAVKLTVRGSIGNTSTNDFSLNIVPGWNLVGNGTDAPIDVASTFSDTNHFVTIWKWIAEENLWAFYAPSLAAQGGTVLADYAASRGYRLLSTIDGGEGFWVNAKQAGIVYITGTAITYATLRPKLAKGWSLVSLGETMTARQFGEGMDGGVISLWAWDVIGNTWYMYSPGLDYSGNFQNYIASRGYLDFASTGKSLDKGTGFWVNKP